jgi:hypothetical protein
MFARVDAKFSGPQSLGILVPQGSRTLVIVRPRALPWDLLPARWDGDHAKPPQFCTFTRDDAAMVARQFVTVLETAVLNPLETFGDVQTGRLQIWLRTSEYVWIVCKRAPGEPYQPMIFASSEEAIQAAEKIAAYVWPAPDVRQEYYYNTQSFS